MSFPSGRSGEAAGNETLQLLMLGAPVATWGGAPLKISRRQVRALLFRLAAEGRPLAREQLCFLFWPDVPELTSRRALTSLLSHLQRALPSPVHLLIDGDSVALDMSTVSTDLLTHQRIVAGDVTQPHTVRLAQAASLYRGPFLDGFSLAGSPEFESWITLERQVWERRHLDTLAALMEAHAEAGDDLAAISTGLRYLKTDELAEVIHRRLIELHRAAGDRPAALRQYKWCAAVLADELGVKPSPETEAAYRRVLRDGGTSVSQPVAVLSPYQPADAGPPAPLAGRAAALRRLEDAWRAATNGHGGVALVSGVRGIGKSRLLEAFLDRLAPHGRPRGTTIVLRGAGHADARSTPYGPLVEALRPVMASGPSLAQLTDCCLAEVTRVLPEVNCLRIGLAPPPALEPAEARTRLFEALYRILGALITPAGTALLCLDDLHEADDATLDWLAYLGRRLAGRRVLVLGAYASEESGRLSRLRQGLARAGVLKELALAPLDEAAVVEVLQRLGHAPANFAVTARSLLRLTGGNPLILMETLRAMEESGTDWSAVPRPEDLRWTDALRRAVEECLEGVSPVARQVLEVAAVLGAPFTRELVQHSGGRDDTDVQDGFDELEARGLLAVGETGYTFAQEVVRVAVLRGLSLSRRRMFELRAGEAAKK